MMFIVCCYRFSSWWWFARVKFDGKEIAKLSFSNVLYKVIGEKMNFNYLFIVFFSAGFNAAAAILDDQNQDFLKNNPTLLSIQADNQKELEKEAREWENKEQSKPIIELLKKGKRKQAKVAIAKYLTVYPDDMQAMEFAGSLLLEDKHYEAAAEAFVRVLRKFPGDNNARVKLGIALTMLGEYSKAKRAFNQVLNIIPENRFSLAYLAWIAQRENNLIQAERYLRNLVQISDESHLSQFHLALARLYYQQKQFKKVINLLDKRNLMPGENTAEFFEANSLLANSYLNLNKIAQAEAKIELLDKNFSEEVDLKFLKALLLRTKKEYAKAIGLYEIIAKDYPVRLIEANRQIAMVYMLLNKPDKAVDILTKIVDKAPMKQVPSLIRDMIAIYSSTGKEEKALTLVDKYVKKFPSSPEVNYLKAEVWVLNKKDSNALQVLNKNIVRFPNYLPNYILASHISEKKSLIDAEKFLQKGIKVDVHNVQVWLMLANLYIRHGAYDKAEEVLKQAIDVNKENIELMFELASIKDSQNKIKEANEIYRKIIAQNVFNEPALHNLLSNLIKNKDVSSIEEAKTIGGYVFDKGYSSPVVLDAYAQVLLKAGDPEKAYIVLTKAIESITEDFIQYDKLGAGKIYFHFANVLSNRGEEERARIFFKKFKSLSDKSKLKNH